MIWLSLPRRIRMVAQLLTMKDAVREGIPVHRVVRSTAPLRCRYSRWFCFGSFLLLPPYCINAQYESTQSQESTSRFSKSVSDPSIYFCSHFLSVAFFVWKINCAAVTFTGSRLMQGSDLGSQLGFFMSFVSSSASAPLWSCFLCCSCPLTHRARIHIA